MSLVPFHCHLAPSGVNPNQLSIIPSNFRQRVPSSLSSALSSASSSSSSSSSSIAVHYQPPKPGLSRLSPSPPTAPPPSPPLLSLGNLTAAPPSGAMFSPNLLQPYPRIAALHHDPIGGPLGPTAGAGPYSNSGGQGYSAFMSTVGNSSAFYPPMNGENVDRWRSISGHVTTPNAWPSFDPTSLVNYPYGSYGGLDVRRKNATRESTSTLKAWLYEHIKNPYPTKGEKIMLAIITKMTLTQVSTWFANARRRLKKENKMQWSPRNRTGDDDDDDDDKNSDNDDDEAESRSGHAHNDDDDDEDEDIVVDSGNDDSLPASSSRFPAVDFLKQSEEEPKNREQDETTTNVLISSPKSLLDADASTLPPPSRDIAIDSSCFSSSSADPDSNIASSEIISTATVAIATPPPPPSSSRPSDKPRIWSLADVATSTTTPPGEWCRRHAIDLTTSHSAFAPVDFRSLPPGNHVTCPSLLTSPVYRGFQPWTSVATKALPVHEAVSGRVLEETGSDEDGVARAELAVKVDRICPSSTEKSNS